MQSIGVLRRRLFGRDADWDEAFNFSKNTRFISACAKKTKGKITHFNFARNREETRNSILEG
jgi:hypothetical protein